MTDLLLVALAGFLASLVDGALGMGFGPTSSSILLSTGLSPAGVSTTVNLAKVATGAAAGISHWRFGNVDKRIVLKLALPGMAGALVGVTVLANVDGDALRPVLAAMLMLVGLRILIRFSRMAPGRPDGTESTGMSNERGVMVAATAGGVTNGLIGAWGPVVTPVLLHKGLAPRFAIGSVNTAEVAVATVSAGSLIATVGKGGLDIGVVIAMLTGGVLAAPIAAWVIRHLPTRGMGVAVSGLLLTTNARELSNWADLGLSRWLVYGSIALVVGVAGFAPRWSRRGDAAVEPNYAT